MSDENDDKIRVDFINGDVVWLDKEPNMSKQSGLGGVVDIPEHWQGSGENYVIVRINGDLTWVSPQKFHEYTEQKEAMGGDWTWEQEIDLDRIKFRHKQEQQRRFEEQQEVIKQFLERKRHEMMILDHQAVFERVITHHNDRFKQDVSIPRINPDGSFDYRPWMQLPKHGLMAGPFGLPDNKKTPPTLEQLKKRRKRNLTFSMPITLAMFISSQYISSLPNLVQWIWTLTMVPACAFFLARGMYLQTKVERVERAERAERAEKNQPEPVPQPIKFEKPKPKSAYEGARDMYVQTGKQQFLDDMLELVTIEEVDYTL